MIDQPNSFMSHLWDSDKVRRARFRPMRASAPDAARRPKSCRRLARAVILRGGDPRLARQRLDSAGKPPIMLRCVATMMRPALRPAGLNRASLPSSARPPSSAAGAWTTARRKEPSLYRSIICGALHNGTAGLPSVERGRGGGVWASPKCSVRQGRLHLVKWTFTRTLGGFLVRILHKSSFNSFTRCASDRANCVYLL